MEWLELEIIPLLLLLLLFASYRLCDFLLFGDGSLDLSGCESLFLAMGPSGVKEDIVDGVDSRCGFCMCRKISMMVIGREGQRGAGYQVGIGREAHGQRCHPASC